MKLTVRPPEEERRRASRMPRRDSTSETHTKSRRRLNCAGTMSCMGNANLVSHAHMLMEKKSSKRKHTCQQTLRLSSAPNSMKMACVCMEIDVNSFTAFMIWRVPSPTHKDWKKEQDLLCRDTSKCALEKLKELKSFGPILSQEKAVEPQIQDYPALKKCTIRKLSLKTKRESPWRKNREPVSTIPPTGLSPPSPNGLISKWTWKKTINHRLSPPSTSQIQRLSPLPK